MVRRRSTVRFRNGAPAQPSNSNLSNSLWEPFREPIGPGSSQDQDLLSLRSPPPALRELRDPRGSGLDLLDCAEDHRRGALDGPVGAGNLCHQVIFVNHASDAVAPPQAEVV